MALGLSVVVVGGAVLLFWKARMLKTIAMHAIAKVQYVSMGNLFVENAFISRSIGGKCEGNMANKRAICTICLR